MTEVAKGKEEKDLVWREVENNRQDSVQMFPCTKAVVLSP